MGSEQMMRDVLVNGACRTRLDYVFKHATGDIKLFFKEIY